MAPALHKLELNTLGSGLRDSIAKNGWESLHWQLVWMAIGNGAASQGKKVNAINFPKSKTIRLLPSFQSGA